MTTSAAEHKAGDKEKVEKRRALGRGLESLLPGPRPVQSPPFAKGAKDGAPTSVAVSGGQQIPPSGRNDNVGGRNDEPLGEPVGHGDAIEGTIRAVVESPVEMESVEAAELRSGGQPGAAVPTFDSSTQGSEDSITIYAQAESRMPGNLVVNLAISDIDKNPFQTRYVDDDDSLEELAESIKANGVVQPILVRPAEEDGRFILILGERRLHASKKAGKTTIPAMVRRVSLQQAAEITIIENLQRENLSALEQAEAFRVLSNEFQLTQAQIGQRVGLSRESVANYMRLLKLPREVMQLLAEKRISFTQAKELLKLGNDDQISKGALYAVKNGLNIEQIERMVLSMNGELDPFPGMPGTVVKKTGTARWVDPNVKAAQLEMERILGVRVKIRDRKGKGKIVIEYSTVDDYERVVEMLRGRK
jgi:ParB family transcriptional regulator, chromosome partitioning protein